MSKYPNVIKNDGLSTTTKKQFFETIEEKKEDSNFGHLTWGEYITIVFIILFGNLELLTDYLKHGIIHGGTVFTVVFILTYLLIGLPLTSLNLFLGHFSKCGFFRLWSISPIYKGVGYTIFILGLLSIIWSSVIASLSFLYMFNLLREEIPWNSCKKIKLEYNVTNCIDNKDLRNTVNNDTCCPFLSPQMCPSNSLNYPSLGLASVIYFRYYITNTGALRKSKHDFLGSISSVSPPLAVCLGVTWIITIVVSTIGLNTTKSLIRKLGTFATLILFFCFIVTVIFGIPRGEQVIEYTTHGLFETNTLALLRLVTSIFGRSVPLNVVCLGARAPSTTLPTIDALFITIVYLVIIFIFAFWAAIKISSIHYLVKLKSVHCITRSGITSKDRTSGTQILKQTEITHQWFKTKLSMTYWIICWKCFPFVGAGVLLYFLVKISNLYDLITEQFNMKIFCAALSCLILLPIPFAAFYYYFRNIRFVGTNNTTLFKNDIQWGPPDAEMRRARNNFNPKFEKRYKSETQQCAHNCLVNSKRLAREVERLEANRKLFLEEVKKLKGDDSLLEEVMPNSESLIQIH